MTPAEFIDRSLSIPWVRGGSDWAGVDCYGLVELWHRHVLGIDVALVEHTDMADGFPKAANFKECAMEAGATCFMGFVDGAPKHCGVLLDHRHVLHAYGEENSSCGRVKVSTLSVMRHLYGEIRFYRYTTC